MPRDPKPASRSALSTRIMGATKLILNFLGATLKKAAEIYLNSMYYLIYTSLLTLICETLNLSNKVTYLKILLL